MFNQFFQNPYLQFLPPQFAQQLQNQQMMDLGTALMQNSYGPANRGGMARFGDALAQWRQNQAGQGTQMMEMRMLAERMRLAEEQNQRQQGVFEGRDAASKLDRERFERPYKEMTPYEKARVDAERERNRLYGEKINSFGGMFPGGPQAAPPKSPADAAKARFEEAQRAGGAATQPPAQQSTPEPKMEQEMLQQQPQSAEQVMQLLDDGVLDKPQNLYYSKQFVRQALGMNLFGAKDAQTLREWLRKRGG